MHAHVWLILAVAGFAAGVVNAIAGGGSLLSFPALLLTGMPSVAANATNTLAVWPGSLSSVWAYRTYIREERHRARTLGLPSLLGGLAGSVLLLSTSEKAFNASVPWLILFACALLAMQGRVAQLVARTASENGMLPVGLWLSQFLISVYGGYFGAGMGILMLAAMAIFLPSSLQHANALKVLCAMLINGIAAVYFLFQNAARLPEAGLMAVASIIGGYVGARLAQRLPATLMRASVIVYGVAIAGVLFYKQ